MGRLPSWPRRWSWPFRGWWRRGDGWSKDWHSTVPTPTGTSRKRCLEPSRPWRQTSFRRWIGGKTWNTNPYHPMQCPDCHWRSARTELSQSGACQAYVSRQIFRPPGGCFFGQGYVRILSVLHFLDGLSDIVIYCLRTPPFYRHHIETIDFGPPFFRWPLVPIGSIVWRLRPRLEKCGFSVDKSPPHHHVRTMVYRSHRMSEAGNAAGSIPASRGYERCSECLSMESLLLDWFPRALAYTCLQLLTHAYTFFKHVEKISKDLKTIFNPV